MSTLEERVTELETTFDESNILYIPSLVNQMDQVIVKLQELGKGVIIVNRKFGRRGAGQTLESRVSRIESILDDHNVDYVVRNITNLMGQVREKLTELGKGRFGKGRGMGMSQRPTDLEPRVARLESIILATNLETALPVLVSQMDQVKAKLEELGKGGFTELPKASVAKKAAMSPPEELPKITVSAEAVKEYDNNTVYSIGNKVTLNGQQYEMVEGAGSPGYSPERVGDSLWKKITEGGVRKSRKSKARKSKARKSKARKSRR